MNGALGWLVATAIVGPKVQNVQRQWSNLEFVFIFLDAKVSKRRNQNHKQSVSDHLSLLSKCQVLEASAQLLLP